MNKNKLIFVGIIFVSLSIGLLVMGCDKKIGKVPVVNVCDTTGYTKHIKPIIEANCLSCHGDTSPSGGFPLTTYGDVKAKGLAGKIKARVIDGVPSFMPPTGPLPEAEKALIQCWLENGMKE
jgi:hypothetical protein